ncbi:hypothetical protein NFHSH190041_27040 [Shewanella sp. NFH-SH190041]|uniref:tetratricopeptide repeat protein n=1 Tax=Shewanella sp. NFH-SH190041 TaxID=2950245 RepID=UPI0021C2F19E|nr:hypothetical protein [Shewanella sp. NFH-SH190041]BDM65252.1 hypothetical protein NFHSH190041_27040 [Shewanella sp. NFH-SH190041]
MNRILTIFLILISFKSVAFGEYSGNHTYHLDIMKNGKTFTLNSEDETLKIFNDKNHLILNSRNFIIDGYSFFSEIKKLPGNHKGFKIINVGDRFSSDITYTIKYYNNSFFVTNVKELAFVRRDGSLLFSNKITCNRNVSYDLNKEPYPTIRTIIFDYDYDDHRKFCKTEVVPVFSLKLLEKYFKEKQLFGLTMADTIRLIKETPVTNKNIVTYNNIAYYVYSAGVDNDEYLKENTKVAIYILEHVIKKSPNRSVAYLNIADAFLSEKNYSKATEMYKKYISILKAKGKEDKIPKRVKDFLLNHK